MTCKELPDCDFIKKIGNAMPHTIKMVEQSCCVDKKRCVKKKLSKIIILIDEADKMPGGK